MENEEQNRPITSKTIFREDIVRRRSHRDRIGIVLENGNDSESEDSESEEDEDKVAEGHVLVSWYPRGHEEEIEEGVLEVVDRSLLHGDVVRWADPSRGSMKGCVTEVKVLLDIKVVGTQRLFENINCSNLQPLQRFYSGMAIAQGAWIAVVEEVFLKLILKLKNGARCIIEGEQVNLLTDNTDQRDEESPFHCEMFYQGQSVAGTARHFRDVQWINGPRPVFSNSQRVTAIVEEATVSGLSVHWQGRGYNGNEEDSTLLPPDNLISEESLSSIHPFNLYNEASIQLGDKAFYTLKESDFPQPSKHPQQEATNKSPLSEASADETGESAKEQPDIKRSKQSKTRKKSGRRGKVAEEKGREEVDDEKYEDNDSSSSEESAADDEDSDHDNARESRQPANINSTTRRNEPRHQAAAAAPRAHGARRRRHFTRKKKKHQVPVRMAPGEKVCVEVISTKTTLSVVWQDNRKEENIPSSELLPVLHVDELEFFPGDFVIDKTVPPAEASFGVVQAADSAQRTCRIKWLDRTENCVDERVSVYDIGDHPDYNFRPASVVVKLEDHGNDNEQRTDDGACAIPPCGEVIRVDNEGNVHVLWTDGTRSEVTPQSLFALPMEDEMSSSGDGSSSDEEWETASDASSEDQNLQINPLEDVIMRSLAALGNFGQNNANNDVTNQEGGNDHSMNEADERPQKESDMEAEESPVQNIGASSTSDVKIRPEATAESASVSSHETFSVLEEVPANHQFVSTMFEPFNPRQFNSAIRKEITRLKSHLPNGVAVKGFENRLDLYSIMIKGPAGTPYEDGIFLFDLQLPQDYPKSPPKVHYLSFCSGKLNPNLYENGFVCVSLLGTWSGKGSEKWTNDSNLCQLIVSLQGLILCEEPYYNEAGYEKHKCTAEGAENSRMYNEMVIIKMLQSVERMIKSPPETFENEIKEHTEEHIPRLLQRLHKWISHHAPIDFLERHSLTHSNEEAPMKPDFPLLPLTFGFCTSLLRALKSLEETIEKCKP